MKEDINEDDSWETPNHYLYKEQTTTMLDLAY